MNYLNELNMAITAFAEVRSFLHYHNDLQDFQLGLLVSYLLEQGIYS